MCVCARGCVRACGYPGTWACACACAHVTLSTQQATRMHHILLSFVVSLALPDLSTLSHKRVDVRSKKVLEHKLCVFIFSTTFKIFFILRRFQRDIIIIVKKYSFILSAFLLRFQWNLKFSIEFRKKTQISNFIKIRLVRARLLHVKVWMDGQTNRYDEANSRFLQFLKRP